MYTGLYVIYILIKVGRKITACPLQAHSIWLQVVSSGLMPTGTFPIAQGTPKLPLINSVKALGMHQSLPLGKLGKPSSHCTGPPTNKPAFIMARGSPRSPVLMFHFNKWIKVYITLQGERQEGVLVAGKGAPKLRLLLASPASTVGKMDRTRWSGLWSNSQFPGPILEHLPRACASSSNTTNISYHSL